KPESTRRNAFKSLLRVLPQRTSQAIHRGCLSHCCQPLHYDLRMEGLARRSQNSFASLVQCYRSIVENERQTVASVQEFWNDPLRRSTFGHKIVLKRSY